MMATPYNLWFIYVLLCTSYTVHSARIKAKFGYIDDKQRVMYVSGYINPSSFREIFGDYLTLHALMNRSRLPALTLTNIEFIKFLEIHNIFLETMPVFINVSGLREMFIIGNKIKTVPANAFDIEGLYRIQLGNNQIDTIADGAFNMDLSVLDLRCNKLRSFSHTWFQYPEGIEHLGLSGNQIEYLQEETFQRMTGLTNLAITHSRLSRIDSAAFRSNYLFFDLSFNNISELSPNMFAGGRTSIRYFHIAYNKLNYLSPKLLRKFEIEEMLIDGNPWQCPCLRNIEKWIRENDVSRISLEDIPENNPVCVASSTISDVCVTSVNSESQELYAKGLSPLQGCFAVPCGKCYNYVPKYKALH